MSGWWADLDWSLLGLIELVWIAAMLVMILLQERTPVATIAWMLALSLLPGIGFGFYLVFGPRRLARKRTRRALARSVVNDAETFRWVRESRRATALGAQAGDPGLGLAELAVGSGEPPPFLCDEVRVYFRGSECFDAIVDAIRRAEHHVHLEYYIFEPGVVATRIRDALVERARAGVEVRFLVDGLGSRSLPRSFLEPLVRAGGEVAVFNSVAFAKFRPTLVNFRTHRKIVVVDGVVGFTGGMNLEDGHDESVVGPSAWRDTHVRLEGDVVAALGLVFLEDWNFANGRGPKGEGYLLTPKGTGRVLAQIVGSGPDLDASFAIYHQFFAAIASARERVLLTTAYFVPDESMITALCSAARRGVDVRILVPLAGDHAFVDAAARSFFPPLLRAGVRIHGYEPSVLHAKTLVVDRHYAAIGTANFDNRSFKLNFELIAAILDEAIADQLASEFEVDLRSSIEFTRASLARDGRPRRLLAAFAKLFAPIL